MVEWYRQGKTTDSSTRALKILPADSFSKKAGRAGEVSEEFCLTKYFFHISKFYLTGSKT
jgi:hypothetical protein